MTLISEQPLVSVVIPTYKRAELISRAINSVLGQSYQNLEIIIVDDHSQDNTAKIIQNITDNRIRYHYHTINQGGAAARNTGINQALGQYVAFLDSDDVWLPQKLELQLKAIAKQANNLQQVVSYTKFQKSSKVFYQPSILPRRGKRQTENIANYFWLGSGEILTSTLLVSRSLATANLFQTNLSKHQDLDFVLRLGFQAAEFIFLPQVLTVWHNESRGDRISQITDYQVSLDWIEAYRNRISEQAYQGFLFKEVVPKMLKQENSKPTAIKLLKAGFEQRTISLHFLLFLIMQQIIPQSFQQSLKTFLIKIKLIKNI
jgi:glycosyltransferase involved in cell wall biosynthesis